MTDPGGMLRQTIGEVWRSGRMPALITPTGDATPGEIELTPIGEDFAAELVEHIYGTDDLPATELVELRIHPEDWNEVGLPHLFSMSFPSGREWFMGVPIDFRKVKSDSLLVDTPRQVAAL